jgi:hypothetical protein
MKISNRHAKHHYAKRSRSLNSFLIRLATQYAWSPTITPILSINMALDAKRRQKKLATKSAKRKTQLINKRSKLRSDSYPAARAARFPIHDCLIPDNLFEFGIGTVILSRSLPNGELALTMFLVDVFCLGIKDAFYRILSQREYELYVDQIAGNTDLESVHPSCLRKLVEGAVQYARELGFAPHSDYGRAAKLFGDIDAAACPVRYTFGKNGKPVYISGTHESPAQSRRILETLARRLGPDEFHFATVTGSTGEDTALETLDSDRIELFNYEITTEPLKDSAVARLPEPVKNQLQTFHNGGLFQRPKEAIATVQQLIEQYPDVPQLYNHLYNAYRVLGDRTNAERVLKETLQQFPDYLFGRIAYASECLQRGEPDKVPAIFEEKYELKLLYPDRTCFHISEVVGFYSIMAWYFHEQGERSRAEVYYKVLHQLDPDHQSTQAIQRLLYPSRLQRWLRNRGLPR